MTKVLWLLLFWVIINECWQTSEADSVKYKRRNNCKIKSEYIIEQRVMNSLLECLTVCGNMTSCETVSWSTDNSSCIFSDENVLHDVLSHHMKWESATGWEAYTRVLVPVARYLNPDPERKVMTFMETFGVCDQNKATLASEDHLLAAEEVGLRKCWCAWASNNQTTMILGRGKECRGFPADMGPTLINCNFTEAAVWCKLN